MSSNKHDKTDNVSIRVYPVILLQLVVISWWSCNGSWRAL